MSEATNHVIGLCLMIFGASVMVGCLGVQLHLMDKKLDKLIEASEIEEEATK